MLAVQDTEHLEQRRCLVLRSKHDQPASAPHRNLSAMHSTTATPQLLSAAPRNSGAQSQSPQSSTPTATRLHCPRWSELGYQLPRQLGLGLDVLHHSGAGVDKVRPHRVPEAHGRGLQHAARATERGARSVGDGGVTGGEQRVGDWSMAGAADVEGDHQLAARRLHISRCHTGVVCRAGCTGRGSPSAQRASASSWAALTLTLACVRPL